MPTSTATTRSVSACPTTSARPAATTSCIISAAPAANCTRHSRPKISRHCCYAGNRRKENTMNAVRNVLLALSVSAALADEAPPAPAPPPAEHVGVADNLFLNAGAGVEKPVGEDSTPYGLFGANWGIPLTQPDNIAVGLQLAGSVKFREDDPELNGTFGGFGRNFKTFEGQRGAFAF